MTMEVNPRILRERNSQLIDKLRENQALLKSSRPAPTKPRPLSPPRQVNTVTTPISPLRPQKPGQATPTEAKKSLLSKRGKRTLTSTPRSTPIKPTTSRKLGPKTPQSILKKRKMIDRHIKVDSKLPDKSLDLTPDGSRSDFLNFSYDASSVKSPYNMRKREKSPFGSPNVTFKSPVKKKRRSDPEVLLKDDGNSRSAVNYEKDKTRRSTTLAPVESTKKNVNRVTFNQSLSRSYSNLYDDRLIEQGPVTAPMLGYDWIAGALDNSKPSALDETDDYFQDLIDFRKQNKDLCVSKQPAERHDDNESSESESMGASTLLAGNDHTCIHTYIVNDRLFAQPLNKTPDGKSACPVCRKAKKDPTSTSPGFVRVSMPAKNMEAEYKVVPHRRRSFDPEDSCALSQHCMTGMQSSRPSSLKPATAVDMRSHVPRGAKSKFVVDSDVDKIIREEKLHYLTPTRLTRSRVAAQDLKSQHSAIRRDPGRDFGNTKKENLSTKTRALLNTSHSLRHHAQKLEMKTHSQPKGYTASTRYPAGV